MNWSLNDAHISAHRLNAKFLFIAVIVLGSFVLFGWNFDIVVLKTVLPGLVSMKVNTALGLIFLSAAGLILVNTPLTRLQRFFALAFTLLTIFISVATLLEYVGGFEFRIDELFYRDTQAMKTLWPPGRPAPVTAISFLFVAAALLVELSPRLQYRKLQQSLLVMVSLVSFQALIGYMAGINYSFGSAPYTQIAVHTAACFICLCGGILLSRPNEGFMRSVLSPGLAGTVGRRLLFFSITIPTIINLVQLYGVRAGLWDDDFGILLRVVTNVAFFSWIAFQTSANLSVSENERAHAEAQRNQTMSHLEKAVKARDELLSVCSHEMRTPVTSMKLITQLTKREISKGDPKALAPENIKYVLDTSERQLDRLTKLIEEILDFSRINAGKLKLSAEDMNLSQLISEVTERFRPVFEAATCKVETHIEKNVRVHWDRFRIEQVVSNLLSNSAKYGAGNPIEISLDHDGENILISVRNQGMGIADKDLTRIFEPYERAVSVMNISGLGLGLYIARQIVEAHGGRIWADSIPGQGALFSVEIPSATALTN